MFMRVSPAFGAVNPLQQVVHPERVEVFVDWIEFRRSQNLEVHEVKIQQLVDIHEGRYGIQQSIVTLPLDCLSGDLRVVFLSRVGELKLGKLTRTNQRQGKGGMECSFSELPMKTPRLFRTVLISLAPM